MKFCALKETITPDKPVFLAGFGGRDKKSEGVIDDTFVKVMLLQGNKDLLLITLDVLGGDRSFVIGIKTALNEKFGLSEDQVLINFSHTHCSVFVTGEDPNQRRGKYSIGQEKWPEHENDVDYTEDIRYFQSIREKIVRLTEQCFDRLEEGTVLLGQGTSDFGVSRRLMTDEGLKFKPNFDAPIDHDLFVLKLVGADGQVKGAAYSYACHPTEIAKNMISSAFAGRSCRYIESRYPGCTALFLQGCGADVKTARGVQDGRFKVFSAEEAAEVGDSMGREVCTILEEAEFTALKGDFHTKLIDVRLYTEVWEIPEIEAIVNNENNTPYKRLRANMLLEAIQEGKDLKHMDHYIMIWKLAENVKLIAMEGEVPSKYALMAKKLLKNDKVIALGYSNGLSTYIPTRQMLKEGGYEVDAVVLHGLRGHFLPEIEEIILGAIAKSEWIEG